MQCLGSSGGWWVTYFADPSKVCPPHQHPLLRGLNLSMLRAARRAAADHVRILLQQLLFFYRVKLTAIQLQFQLEEAMDDLENLGFDGQLLLGILHATTLELRRFIARCNQAMIALEHRILYTFLR